MKSKFVPLLAAMLLAFPVAGAAAVRNSATIRLDTPATVGHQRLQTGDYKVEWNGRGPQVQVKFLKGKKTVATTAATLQQHAPTSYLNGAVEVQKGANNRQFLREIFFKDKNLQFPAGS